MKSITTVLLCALALACAAAQAQGYQWVDKDGKTRYGDAPPAGVTATPMKPPAGSPQAAPAAAAAKKDDGKDAKKPPPTPEQGFKERQLKAKEDAEKAAKEEKEEQTRKQNCERSQAGLRNLESGQRISQTNAAGERAFLDDAERAVRIAESRKLVAEWCK